MGAFMNCVFFPKISGLCQEHKVPWNLLVKLGEVFKNNFLTAMQDLKRRIKALTSKNWCHTISEQSLLPVSFHVCDMRINLFGHLRLAVRKWYKANRSDNDEISQSLQCLTRIYTCHGEKTFIKKKTWKSDLQPLKISSRLSQKNEFLMDLTLYSIGYF